MTSGEFVFLHAADLHIDSPLSGLSNYEGAPAEPLRLATRDAFRRLVEAALEREVAFVVLAGDLFDGEWRSYDSGLWFSTQLRELGEAGIEVFVVRGNHDAESKVTPNFDWPENVHFFASDAAESLEVAGRDVVLHGQSYAVASIEHNLVPGYPAPVANAFNIGVLHTALNGREGHGTYAPCTLGDLKSKGYDYWALGHVHAREVVSEDPWVVFPGNLQGRHVRETGPKGAVFVHVAEGRVERIEELVCDVARWAHIRIDAGRSTDMEELFAETRAALSEAQEGAAPRLLAARVTFEGQSELDAALRLDEVSWRQRVRGLGVSFLEDVWVEKVEVRTSPSGVPAKLDDGLIGLAERLAEARVDDDELATLTRELEGLANKLPEPVRAMINPGDRTALADLLDPARRYLAALLAAEPDSSADEL